MCNSRSGFPQDEMNQLWLYDSHNLKHQLLKLYKTLNLDEHE